MPDLDGMELSKKLRSKLPNLKIIFISAYSEIEYLRSALEVDAVDYILKPINLNTLSSIIGKTVKILNDEKKQQELIEELHVKLDESMPLLREKFFITLLII
jgi:two-component system response regulator YesN